MESPGQAAETVDRFIRAINTHNVDELLAMMSSDHVMIDSIGNSVYGMDLLKKAWTGYFQMFPDYTIHVQKLLAEEKNVAVFGFAEGTYSEDGSLEKGNHWRIPAAWLACVESGRIRQWQVCADNDPVRRVMEGKRAGDAGDLILQEIRYAKYIPVSPDRVYDAMATAKGLDGWFTCGAEVDARAGGHILFRWKDFGPDRVTGEDGGAVLEADRPRRFVFQWSPDHPSYVTTVELDFEPLRGGTVVRVRESGYRNTREGLRAILNCSAGWGEALTMLRHYLEHGIRDHTDSNIDHAGIRNSKL